MNYIKKQSKPKISVIMSVYNGLPYIKEAVNSVLGQTYKSFEFVIVDDASIDDSWKYLKSLKDKRIRLLKNKKNIGLAASLNSALKAAKGDYIARMDADDISLPKRFETQLKFLESHPEVDLCGTWVNIIDPKGKKIGEKKYSTSSKKIKKILSFYSSIIHPTFMGKKEYFIKLGGYTSKYDFAEDYDLLMRGRSIFTMANIPKILLSWRYQNRLFLVSLF